MDRIIYTAKTGMDAAMNRQRTIANNLANASTPGFRAEEFAVTPATIKGDTLEARAMALGGVRGVDLAPGQMQASGRGLDVALRGDALLAVQTADGEEVYTRRGDLSVSPTGLLENGDGLLVLGANGPISVPPGIEPDIAPNGNILVRDPAAPEAAPAEVARLKLVDPSGSAIAKGLDGQLRVIGGGVLPEDPTARVMPGMLEASNVNQADVLVQMIEAQRAFEARAKLMRTAGELDEAGARLMSLR